MTKTAQAAPRDIDQYIAGFPPEVQAILEKVRLTIHKAAPEAQETIKYGMPTYTLHGNLVYFGAFTHHIGFYPPVAATGELKQELLPYEGPKRSLRFPLDQPIPYELIARVVTARVRENMTKTKARSRASQKPAR